MSDYYTYRDSPDRYELRVFREEPFDDGFPPLLLVETDNGWFTWPAEYHKDDPFGELTEGEVVWLETLFADLEAFL